MKVATLEKFHLRGGNQDPGDPGVEKVRGEDFFSFKQGGTDPGWHYEYVKLMFVFNNILLSIKHRCCINCHENLQSNQFFSEPKL